MGFARIRSKGDEAFFGGNTTKGMKIILGVPENRPLADFLPDITVKIKDVANELTKIAVEKDKTMIGESCITGEHIKSNRDMREMMTKRGVYPERLPKEEDVKKIERKLKSEGKKLSKITQKLK